MHRGNDKTKKEKKNPSLVGVEEMVGNICVSWFLLFLPKESSVLIVSFKCFTAEGWSVASSKASCLLHGRGSKCGCKTIVLSWKSSKVKKTRERSLYRKLHLGKAVILY